MENRNVFWGVLLVAVGALFIFDNMDLIDFSFSALISLWPVLLVLWGISILPVKAVYKTVGALLIAVFALVYASTSDKTFWWEGDIMRNLDKNVHMNFDHDGDEIDEEETYYTFTFDEEEDAQIQEANLVMDVAAGKFRIDDTTTEHIIDFDAYSNIGPYTSNMVTNGNTADIQIGLEDAFIKNGTNRNRASVKLNPNIIWDINMDVGAADLRADLRKFKVRNIDIDGGASSINLKIGELLKEMHLKLDAGAASIKISIPENAGCKIDSESFLVDLDLEGFVKNEEGDHVTANFEDSEQKIYIEVDAAISQLTVTRYSIPD